MVSEFPDARTAYDLVVEYTDINAASLWTKRTGDTRAHLATIRKVAADLAGMVPRILGVRRKWYAVTVTAWSLLMQCRERGMIGSADTRLCYVWPPIDPPIGSLCPGYRRPTLVADDVMYMGTYSGIDGQYEHPAVCALALLLMAYYSHAGDTDPLACPAGG